MVPLRFRHARIINPFLLQMGLVTQLAALSRATRPQPGQIDACSLLKKAEVEAAVGHPVPEPRKQQAGNVSSCTYEDSQTHRLIATLEVVASTDPTQAREIFKARSQSLAKTEPVGGLGDDARWNPISMNLHVLRGKYVVSVVTQRLDAAKKLVANTLQRLP